MKATPTPPTQPTPFASPTTGPKDASGKASYPLSYSASAVHTLTGNYTYAHTDVTTHGPEPIFAFVRSYNSNDTRVTPLGPGWSHNFNIRLNLPGDGTKDIILVGPQGRSDRHTYRPDGTYAPRSGVPVTLRHNPDGTYTANHEDGTVWTFGSNGKLYRIIDSAGRSTKLNYKGFGVDAQLISIEEPAGRGSLRLDYDPKTGRLVSVTDWLGPPRVVRYAFDEQGRLRSATDREEQTTHYAYDGDSQRLATITDARGNVAITIRYDPQGRVTARYDARGLKTGQARTLQYKRNPDGTTETTHQYPPSSFEPDYRTTMIDYYDSQGRIMRRVSHPSSTDEPLIEGTTYAPGGRRLDSRRNGTVPRPSTARDTLPFDPDLPLAPLSSLDLSPRLRLFADLIGSTLGSARVTRDSFGRVEMARRASGPGVGSGEEVWTLQYDREDRLRFVEKRGTVAGGQTQVTEMRYDEVGNLILVVEPEGERTDYHYDEQDSLVEVRSSKGLAVRFEYDERGDLAKVRGVLRSGGQEEAVDYAYDGLSRLRRVTQYPSWPDTARQNVTEFSYDEQGSRSPFSYTR